jgi:hypothetical protein
MILNGNVNNTSPSIRTMGQVYNLSMDLTSVVRNQLLDVTFLQHFSYPSSLNQNVILRKAVSAYHMMDL